MTTANALAPMIRSPPTTRPPSLLDELPLELELSQFCEKPVVEQPDALPVDEPPESEPEPEFEPEPEPEPDPEPELLPVPLPLPCEVPGPLEEPPGIVLLLVLVGLLADALLAEDAPILAPDVISRPVSWKLFMTVLSLPLTTVLFVANQLL